MRGVQLTRRVRKRAAAVGCSGKLAANTGAFRKSH